MKLRLESLSEQEYKERQAVNHAAVQGHISNTQQSGRPVPIKYPYRTFFKTAGGHNWTVHAPGNSVPDKCDNPRCLVCRG